MSEVHIAVLMMVKNEHKRLYVSLESIKDFADSLIIYDTGSTDNTIQICRDFSEKYKIPLRLKEGTFINFEVSRNIALDFADTFDDVEFILMLDTNDELRGADKLRKFAESHKTSDKSAFLISQEWWSGSSNKYFNTRFIKSRDAWRYKGVVHEYLQSPNNIEDCKMERINDNDIFIYQDRTSDDDKTGKRFVRDEILLKEEYKKYPNEPRTVFYLAQTYACLNDHENSFYYYKIRTTLGGFYEEKYEAFYKCGELSELLKFDWHDSFVYYIKAYELIPRAEPLIRIVEHYRSVSNWILAYTFVELACRLNYPSQCILFVDKLSYEYKRWHLLGIVGYYSGFLKEGKVGCQIAIQNGIKNKINVDIDKTNLKFYETPTPPK